MKNKSTHLYETDKLYRKLYNLMFSDFGWDVTCINEDCLKIYKVVKKCYKE